MVKVEYLTSDWYCLESYFETVELAYRWINIQGPFVEWFIFDDNNVLYDCGGEKRLKCLS